MKKIDQHKFMNTLSFILILFLLLFTSVKNIPRLILIILLIIPVILSIKAPSVISFFRILSIEIAFLPVINYPVNFKKIQFQIPDYRDFLQSVITFSELIRIFIPILIFLVICVMKKKNRSFNSLISKYILHAIGIIIICLIGTFIPEIRELCKIAYTYIIILIINDITENYLYKNYNNILYHLPYFFLYITSIFNTLTLPNSNLSLRAFIFK